MRRGARICDRKNTVIFDLDGTIAKTNKRLSLATVKGKLDWDVFLDPNNIDLDLPNKPVVEALRLFYYDGYEIIILSGRTAKTREASIQWLRKHHVPYDELNMRPVELHYVADDVLKWDMLKVHGINKEDILCVFDDRKSVVDMWRTEGLTCFQVAEGNF